VSKGSQACQSPEKGDCASNNLFSHSKILRQILEIVYLEGSISEIRIFDLFGNRRTAIDFIGRMTTGCNRAFDSYLDGGLRYYRFSQHFLKKQADLERSL